MKIEIVCHDGSPLGVTSKDVWGKGKRGVGIGGSELALLTMCEQWTSEGEEVILYNNPLEYGASPFEQRRISDFNPNDIRDILITFRSPNARTMAAKGLKVWWSCDQFTRPDLDFKTFAPYMNKIVLISPFHQEYFKMMYNIHNTIVIDLPVRINDFSANVKKVPGKCIFTSVPDRGLQYLHAMWPIIKRDNPHATITITSDYRLWGNPSPGNDRHKHSWLRHEGSKFVGALPRDKYIKELQSAELLLYPSFYDTAELFCISVSEAQYAGVYPITSDWGALETTNMGTVIDGDPTKIPFREAFQEEVHVLLSDPAELSRRQFEVSEKAFNRFNPEFISKQWMENVFNE